MMCRKVPSVAVETSKNSRSTEFIGYTRLLGLSLGFSVCLARPRPTGTFLLLPRWLRFLGLKVRHPAILHNWNPIASSEALVGTQLYSRPNLIGKCEKVGVLGNARWSAPTSLCDPHHHFPSRLVELITVQAPSFKEH
jgi:hypothetical protein